MGAPVPEPAPVPRPRTRLWRIALLALGPIVIAGAVAWQSGALAAFQRPRPPANELMVIAPYRYQGTWVFDDARAGLVKEPFVAGVPEMIDMLVEDVPNAENGFRMLFSAKPFPGYQKIADLASRSVGRQLLRPRRTAHGRMDLPRDVQVLRRGAEGVVREGRADSLKPVVDIGRVHRPTGERGMSIPRVRRSSVKDSNSPETHPVLAIEVREPDSEG